MTARATGAFLLALIAIGWAFGPTTGERDFLIGVAAAAAVGIGTALWLRRDERKPPPDVFDERATRSAVRRGVVRTALVAVVWVFLGAFVLQIASGLWQTRGDRRDHFALVAEHGFYAANAGYRPGSHGCCTTHLRSLEFSIWLAPRGEPRENEGGSDDDELELKLDLRGRLQDIAGPDVPRTAVDAAGDPRPKHEVRELLAQLPEPVVLTGVAELARPLEPAAFYSLLDRHGLAYPLADVAVYLEPANRPREHDGIFLAKRVSWPTPALAGFQAWVKQLRGSDDEVLDGLRLPSRARLRELASEPRVHAFVLERWTPARLRRLLDDPAVRGVALGDVSFELRGEQ